MWTDIDTALARVSSAVNQINAIVAIIETLANWQPDPNAPITRRVLVGGLTEQAQPQMAIAEHVANAHAALASATATLQTAHANVIQAVTAAQTQQENTADESGNVVM